MPLRALAADRTFDGLLLGVVGDEETTGRFLLGVEPFDEDAIVQETYDRAGRGCSAMGVTPSWALANPLG